MIFICVISVIVQKTKPTFGLCRCDKAVMMEWIFKYVGLEDIFELWPLLNL